MNPSVSVVTAALDCAADLTRLVASLRTQTDRQFDFIVLDGGSKDGTWDVIEAARDVVTYSVREPDHGVYDALNKGVRVLRTDFYLVVGADDVLYPDAIANYKAAARNSGADIIVASVKAGRQVRRGFHPEHAWRGHHMMVTSHSVGMLFRATLHERFGLYSLRYPLLADGYFIKRACTDPEVRTIAADFVAGEFGLRGMSNRGLLQTLCEMWQIQLATGENRFVQYLLFQGRLLRYLPHIMRK